MNKRLKELMVRLTPEEQNGAILEVEIPEGIDLPNQTPPEILGEVRQALATRAVGEALARARQQAGLRAKDIANRLDVSAPRVAQVESSESNMTLATLLEHAQASGCEVEIVLRPHDRHLPLITAPLMGLKKTSTRKTRVLKPGSFDPVKSVRRLRDGK